MSRKIKLYLRFDLPEIELDVVVMRKCDRYQTFINSWFRKEEL